jgi:hypothetical protein
MRLFLASLLTALSAVLPAQQPFDTRGLPVDSTFVLVTGPAQGLQISNTSPAMKSLRERVEKLSAKVQSLGNDAPDMEKILRTEFGINTDDNNNTVAFGLKFAGPEDISGVGILRVKIDPKRVDAFAKKHGIAPLTAGGRTGWNALQFIDVLSNPKAGKPVDEPGQPPIGVFVVDTNTVVVCSAKEAAACFAGLAGKAPSFALSKQQSAMVAETGKGYLFAGIDFSRLPQEFRQGLEQNGVTAVNLAVGEKGPSQIFKVTGDFSSAEKAKLSGQQIQGFLAAAPLLLAVDPSEPIEQQALKKIGAELVASIQPVKVEGKQASLVVSLETAKMIGIANQVIDMLEKQAEAQGSPTAPAATPAVKASGGKKKPAAPAAK